MNLERIKARMSRPASAPEVARMYLMIFTVAAWGYVWLGVQ